MTFKNILTGLNTGVVVGLYLGLSPWGTAGASETIYDQISAGEVDAFILDMLGHGSVNDFLPVAVWPMDDFHTDGLGLYVNTADNTLLYPESGADDAASPHGRGVVSTDTTCWATTDDAANITFSTFAWAFAIRVKVPTAPASNKLFMSRGAGASPHFGFGVNSSGHAILQYKTGFGGPPTVLDTGVNICDGEYHWILGGRTVTNSKMWIYVSGGSADAAASGFDIDSSLQNIRTAAAGAPGAFGVPCTIDHTIIWSGTPAENVYTNRADLLFEDG